MKRIILLVLFFYSLHTFSQTGDKLFKGQDPSVVYKDGFYYLIQQDENLVIRKSRDIEGLKTAPKKSIWPNECCNIWAPELQYINGKWYVYYSKDDGNNDNHRMYVLESTGSDPLGPYISKGKICDPLNDFWAIDGSVLQKEDGSLYFIWSGWLGKSNGKQNLYISPMSSPTQISGKRVLISEPSYSWECNGMPINEGPQPFKKNGKYFITFSASGSWTDNYCLGMLTNVDGNLLNASSWIKSKEPVFKGSQTAYGPGHHCLVEGPEGECWNFYHANEVSGTGWNGRSIRVQSFSWDSLDHPVMDKPFLIETPSGQIIKSNSF